jgi:hypothetical protein
MISTFYIFSFLFISNLALANEDCISTLPTNEIIEAANSLQIPNCNQRKIVSEANSGNFSPLCNECKSKRNHVLGVLGSPQSSESEPQLLLMMIEEFKKSLASNLLEIAKLRAVNSGEGDFSSAISECDIDRFTASLDPKNCTIGSLGDLKKDLNNELARILSPEAIFDDKGLFDRSMGSKQCKTSDAQIIQAMSETLESDLSAAVIEEIKKFDPSKDVLTSLREKFGEAQFIGLFSKHPVLSGLANNPKEFVGFFNSLPKNTSAQQLKSALSEDKKTKTSSMIANKCSSSFKAFRKVACSPDVQQGRGNFKNLQDIRPLVGNFNPTKKEFIESDNQAQLEENSRILKICNFHPEQKSIDLSYILNDLHAGMPEAYAMSTYKDVRKDKYNDEIGNNRDAICGLKQPCNPEELTCRISNKLNDPAFIKLSESSNPSVNKLLRSMIGTASDLSPKTKEILIAKGIIPDSSGKIIEQPKILERSRNFASNEPTQPVQALQPTQQSQPQATQSAFTAPTRSQSSAPASQSAQTQSSPTSDPTSFDFLSRSISDSRDQLAKINENILNRLSKPNAPQSVTRDDFRQMTREAYKEQNRTLPASEEEEFVNNYFPQQQSTSPTQFANSKAAQFDKPTSAEQLRRNLSNKQRNEALAKFAGARDGQGSAASEEAQPQRGPASERASTATAADIAVNLPEGSTRLSEVLTSQLPDLKKMIEKGDDFTFKIRQTSNDSVFKIVKNGPNKFDVVFLSGDEKKAPLYKTELQSILDRLTVRASRDALRNALTTP